MFYKYFKGLDGLRFIAATAVIVHHAVLIKVDFGFPNVWRTHLFSSLGPMGVTFFFVLSGFLITYLLLKEKKINTTISLKRFYLRRVFRILPLYYLITILSFLILPLSVFFDQPFFSQTIYQEYWYKFGLYMFLLPQIVFIQFPNAPIPYGVVAWSIGVEEQFYLIWPLLIRWFKRYWYMFLLVFLAFSVLPVFFSILTYFFPQLIGNNPFVDFSIKYLQTLRFSCMAFGGSLALILIENKTAFLKFLYNPFLQLGSYFLLIILLKYSYPFRFFEHEVYSLIFGVIILNSATNNEKGIHRVLSTILDSKFFTFMGARSYGIYMYHMIGIQISIKLFVQIFGKVEMSVWHNVFYYSFTLLFTFGITMISYKWFEKPIMNTRNSYSKS